MNDHASTNLRGFIGASAWPFILSVLSAALCYSAADAELNLYIGSILFATILAPPLVLAERAPMRQLVAAGSIVDGVGIVWLFACFRCATTLWQWLLCYLMLACYIAAISTVALLLVRIGFNRILASAVVVVLGLAWLAWPVWLSPWLTDEMAAWLAPAHPILALNGQLRHLGMWGEQTIAYHLTNLGQHVRYELPAGVGLASLVHLLIAAVIVAILVWWDPKDPKAPRASSGPSDQPATPSHTPAPEE
jgi:hypothetical protein